MFKKKSKLPKTIADFIPFQDVWNNLVYLDNNRIVGGIKIGSINLHLLFDEEQKIKVAELKKVLNSIDYPVKIFSVDKPINLDDNLNLLGSKIKSENNKNKIKLLEEDYNFVQDLNNKKWVVNREFYLIMEEDSENEQILNQKLNDLIQEEIKRNPNLVVIMISHCRAMDFTNKAMVYNTKSRSIDIKPYKSYDCFSIDEYCEQNCDRAWP